MKVNFRALALSAGFLALLAVQLPAQVLTGSISGTVSDASGAVLPDATVTASSPAMAGTRDVTTSSEGTFKILELLPGTYEIRVAKTGFRPVVTQNIVINTGVDARQDIRMEIGDVSQTVTVEAQSATIDTEHVTLAQVAGHTQMEEIPNGRSPWAIGETLAAVATTTYDVGGSSGMQQASLTSHGSTAADQKFMIDGVSVNWPGGGGGSTLMYYDMGMFQEVNYLIGAVPADVSQGGVYQNMITIDGSNQLHGHILATGASQGMQSNNIDPTLATALFRNLNATTRKLVDLTKVNPGAVVTENYDYNGQLSGAFIKDKLWFATSWRLWAVNNYVAGSFNTDGSQVLNDNRIADEMGKIGWQINQKNRFNIMYFRNQKNRYHRVNQGTFGDENSTSVLQNQPGYDLDLKWTYVPNSKWVVDVGAALTAGKTPYRYQNAAPAGALSVIDNSTSTVFNIAQYTYLNPVYRVAIDGFASYYTSNFTGNHNFKFGYQYSKDGYNQLYSANGDLQGQENNGVAATALLYNTPIKEQKNNLSIAALYAMDTWTIKRHLTLNVGIRWENWKGSIPAEVSPAGTYAPARNFAAQDGIINWKNFTPRFGFSYDVFGKGKTVIKGSVNRYVQGEGMALLTTVNPLSLITATVPWTCPAGTPALTCQTRGPQPSELNLSGFTGFTTLLPKIDSSIKRPYSWEESFGIQQQLPGSIIVSVTGWYRTTRNQIGRANTAVPTSAYTPFSVTNPITNQPLTLYYTPTKSTAQISYSLINSKQLDLWYRGIDFSAQRRMTKNLMVYAGLTYGHNNGAVFGDINGTLDDLNNPNYSINRSGALNADATVNSKISAQYIFKWHIKTSLDYEHATGYPLQNQYSLTSGTAPTIFAKIPTGNTLVNNATQLIYLVPSGTNRLPSVNLTNLRISKVVRLKEKWRLEPFIDLDNLFNANTVTSVNQRYDALAFDGTSLFKNPTVVLFPRLYKIGMTFDF